MSIDHPHSGNSPDDELIERIVRKSYDLAELIGKMASIEGDVRLGGAFALMDHNGNLLHTWKSAPQTTIERIQNFQFNAVNKCIEMHIKQVVCSGIVANPEADPPIYDGGIQLENGWYLAFSGYPAEYDRVLCMMIGAEVNVLEMPGLRYNTIMRLGPNESLVRGLLHSAMAQYFHIEYARLKAEQS